MGSEFAPPGPLFSIPLSPPGLSLAEAFANWKWLKYLASKVVPSKEALIIFMDETAQSKALSEAQTTFAGRHKYRSIV